MFEKNRILIAGVYSEEEHDAYMSEPWETGKRLYAFGMEMGTKAHLGYEFWSDYGVKKLDTIDNYEEIDKPEPEKTEEE